MRSVDEDRITPNPKGILFQKKHFHIDNEGGNDYANTVFSADDDRELPHLISLLCGFCENVQGNIFQNGYEWETIGSPDGFFLPQIVVQRNPIPKRGSE